MSDIYTDYTGPIYNKYHKTAKELVTLLEKDAPAEVHCIYGRAKEPEHLIEKIIRKVGNENSEKYHSQHYLVNYQGIKCEIQVRTLAEEVYGEYDHRVRYPYQAEINFCVVTVK